MANPPKRGISAVSPMWYNETDLLSTFLIEVDEDVNPPMIPTLEERNDWADAFVQNAMAAIMEATSRVFFISNDVLN